MTPDVPNPVNKLAPNPPELAALIALEATVDAIRFRVDGMRPDLLRERPEGFSQTMMEVIAELRLNEHQFDAVVRRGIKENNPSAETRFNAQPTEFVSDPVTEIGAFLQQRERVLAALRRLSDQQWGRTVSDPARGAVSLRQLAGERAENDLEKLDLLRDMRQALLRSLRPGLRTMQGDRLPDATA